jgi:hypothetical protein
MSANDLPLDPSARVAHSTPNVPSADESVEALEEALEAARLRLQQRLAGEIEHQHTESDRLKKHCELLRAEAITMEEQAKETAARIVADARRAEAQLLAEARQVADAIQIRLHNRVGTFLEGAAEELAAAQDLIVAARSPAEVASNSVESKRTEPSAVDERVVTRLIVRPAVPTDLRMRLKERIERLPGIDAALLGAVDEESFEMLLAHEHKASVLDSLGELAPEQLRLTARHEGRLEFELAGVEWLRSPGEDQRRGQESGAAAALAS